jgi:hypothetical protein
MSEFAPVETLADLVQLDEAEILDGYRSGCDGDPEPGNNRSRAFWHGWRNGAIDRGRSKPDAASKKLAHAYLARLRTN